jgi:hypothetical protein
MTTIQGHDYDDLLREATEQLIRQRDHDVAAGQIIAAVARAKIRVRHNFAAYDFEPPPPDEYVALVAGLAKQDLIKNVVTSGLPRPRAS